MKQIWMAGTLILVCLVIGGCRNESQRLADMADRTVEMQSHQNMSTVKAGDELAKLNRDVQAERQELNRGFSELEASRRDLNKQRRSDLAWAESFQFLGIVLAATMPLFLCAYLIWAATRSTSDPELANQVLMRELVSNRPMLIAGPNSPAITNQNGSSQNPTSRQIAETPNQEGENKR